MTTTEPVVEQKKRPPALPGPKRSLNVFERVFEFFASLRLTVVFLCLATVLVFLGTLAQVDEGLYNAQNRYFRSLLIYWSPAGAAWKVPVFPGGYFIGGVLLLNLIAAHFKRFKPSWSKLGISVTHAGIVLLLVGQFATDMLQVESAMRLQEGEAKNYSESQRDNELVVIDPSDPAKDRVVSIPERALKGESEIRHQALPFAIRVKNYFQNSRLSEATPGATTAAQNGIGARANLQSMPPVTDMEQRDIPSAVIELIGSSGSLGTWLVSSYLDETQPVAVDGKTYHIAMRFTRHYKPFSIQLLKFTHERYKGTEIPKNFASRVRLENPQQSEAREVLIYMNNPLRYGGETYYQSGYDRRNDQLERKITILQVVRNPGWLTPYLACGLVTAGLIYQFMYHLLGFIRKRRTS